MRSVRSCGLSFCKLAMCIFSTDSHHLVSQVRTYSFLCSSMLRHGLRQNAQVLCRIAALFGQICRSFTLGICAPTSNSPWDRCGLIMSITMVLFDLGYR